MKPKLGIKFGDVILMAGIVILALVLFVLPFFAEKATTAEIVYAETGETRKLPLDKDAAYDIESRGVKLSVRVQDGEVFVETSDCRDAVCKNTPPISRAGQSIVCAPAGVVIRISGEGAVVDGVSG